MTRLHHTLCIALCTLGLWIAPDQAHADGDPATDAVPRAIPYQGVLEFNGAPVDATGDNAVSIRFALFDGPEADQPVYSQVIQVEVYRGRFTAAIGPVDDAGVPIERIIANADALELGMTLLGEDLADPSDDIALTNRQKLMATPYALWTTAAANFTVAADLTVGGNVAVGGNIDMAGGTLNLGGGTLTGVGTFDGNLQLTGGTLDLGDGVLAAVAAIEGDVAVTGQIDAQGGLRVGDHEYEPRYHISHTVKGSTVLLDQDRIAALCGDVDGCQVRLGMRLWRGAQDTAAASREFILYYDVPSRRWRSSRDSSGRIGDDARQHVIELFDTCFLTDTAHQDFRNLGDDGLGFKLLLWRGFNGPDRRCELTFID